ncbi:unnamed protein product [Cylicostephanus goldi]|uniref:Uncharacterized protein n=1 Tax=Cylicostephanus goldi TaxID=71465 RepID=A0A3P6Q9R9_CYLGO|nr:unnamed protein product [Cylicostephanus goldi]
MRRQRKVLSRESTHSPDTSDASGDEQILPFKVRGAPVKRPAGYQPELACLVPWPSTSQADSVTATALNSAFGVIALGMTNGLALVDIAQCALIYAWTTPELYGSDPTPAIQLQMSEVSSPSPIEVCHQTSFLLHLLSSPVSLSSSGGMLSKKSPKELYIELAVKSDGTSDS